MKNQSFKISPNWIIWKLILIAIFSINFIQVIHLQAQNFAFSQNQKLGRGINLGNALEAPNEGDWGVTLQENYFELIASKGFRSVRVPIRWSTHALSAEPYTINETFFQRIDWVIQNALKNKLMIIINCHHYEEIFQNPGAHKTRFLKIWSQIAQRYASLSDSVVFEPLNEPNTNLTAELWNEFFAAARDTIRKFNPGKSIVVGIAEWGGIGGLSKLVLPQDTNLILTVHYYNPFAFTHQGAEWVNGSNDWLGTQWCNSVLERQQVENEFAAVKNFANTHNIPVHVGEFGAYNKADLNSRIKWTNYCSRYFEQEGFSWAYWEFCSGFGIYNSSNATWNQGLVDALQTMPMPDPYIDPSGNMLFNGDYSFGKTNWSTYTQSPASATFSITNGKGVVNISNGSNTDWHVQLYATGLNIVQGKTYRIEFDAYASKSRTINFGIAKSSSPYTNYYSQSINLSTSSKRFSYDFTMMQPTDSIARFLLNLGANNGLIYIDNVFIQEVNPTGTGMKLKQIPVRIFPNPASDIFIIEMPGLSSLAVYNTSGQILADKRGIGEDKFQMNCSNLPKGNYILKAVDQFGNLFSNKLIIDH